MLLLYIMLIYKIASYMPCMCRWETRLKVFKYKKKEPLTISYMHVHDIKIVVFQSANVHSSVYSLQDWRSLTPQITTLASIKLMT